MCYEVLASASEQSRSYIAVNMKLPPPNLAMSALTVALLLVRARCGCVDFL